MKRFTFVYIFGLDVEVNSRSASKLTLLYRQRMEIRSFTEADTDVVVELWRAAGLLHPNNDPHCDINRRTSDSPWGFLVAVDESSIIGSVMVGYDGHRGWINYLACHPDHQRKAVGTALMTRARELLLDRGCPKINLQVRSGNDAAIDFYESIASAPLTTGSGGFTQTVGTW